MLSAELMPGAEQATATDSRTTTTISQRITTSRLFPQAAAQSSPGIDPGVAPDGSGGVVYSAPPPPAAPEPMLFGVKRKYVYIGGGVLAGLVVLKLLR
jgi:hypothetical protein